MVLHIAILAATMSLSAVMSLFLARIAVAGRYGASSAALSVFFGSQHSLRAFFWQRFFGRIPHCDNGALFLAPRLCPRCICILPSVPPPTVVRVRQKFFT